MNATPNAPADARMLWRRLERIAQANERRHPRAFPTVAAWQSRKAEIAAACRRAVGLDPWPARCDPAPRPTGVVQCDGYRIECLALQTLPGVWANAWLFLPAGAQHPLPAMVHPHGHWMGQRLSATERAQLGLPAGPDDGNRPAGDTIDNPNVRLVCVDLARRGFAVLTYDALCQGARPPHRAYHNDARAQALLLGHDISGDMLWESMRMIDYLGTRAEIDPSRIGLVGYSGGGFNALYTALLDPRVAAVAAGGFAVSFLSLLRRGHAGCCAYHAGFAPIADVADAYAALAPRPLLIFGGGRDAGLAGDARRFGELARDLYAIENARERVDVFLDPDTAHLFTKAQREAVCDWLERWLAGGAARRHAVEHLSAVADYASDDAVALNLRPPDDARGIFYIDHLRNLRRRLETAEPWPSSAADFEARAQGIRERLALLLGVASGSTPVAPPLAAEELRNAAPAERLLQLEDGVVVPVAVWRQMSDEPNAILLYYTDRPRESVIESQRREGSIVVQAEVRGTGASRPEAGEDYLLHALAQGRYLFAEQLADFVRVVDWLHTSPGLARLPLRLLACGLREGAQALCWSAVDARLRAVRIEQGLVSWADFLERDKVPSLDTFVPGILRLGDLPRMAALCLAEEGLCLAEPRNACGKPLDRDAIHWYCETFAWRAFRRAAPPFVLQSFATDDAC